MPITTGKFENPFHPGQPIGRYKLTQPFKRGHYAIDVVPSYHTANTIPIVYSLFPGTVKVRINPLCGNGVEITSNPTKPKAGNDGVWSLYCHLDKIFVDDGDFVQYGQPVGTMGNTGRSTGPHLHWVLYVDGRAVNIVNTDMNYWHNLRERLGLPYNENITSYKDIKNILGILFAGVSIYYVSSRS